MKVISVCLVIMLVVVIFAGCMVNASKIPSNGNSQIVGVNRTNQALQNAQEFCNRLAELKKIPYDYSEKNADPVFDGLVQAGEDAIPCLIERVDDSTIIVDPREGDPHIHGFTVGDAAVFMLLIITHQDEHPEEMLPADVAKQWNNDGIYTYFKFVGKPENRKVIQEWWRKWFKKRSETRQ